MQNFSCMDLRDVRALFPRIETATWHFEPGTYLTHSIREHSRMTLIVLRGTEIICKTRRGSILIFILSSLKTAAPSLETLVRDGSPETVWKL